MGNKKDGRTTVYNNITSDEKLQQVNPENKELEKDFLEYLASIDRSKGTIKQYKANLHVFWCWNLENNNNKAFHKMTKREFSRFQNHALNEWGWSPKRVRTVKATLSSLSNFIADILDDEDEYEDFQPIVRKIESPANIAVREKTVFEEKELQSLLNKLVESGSYMKACALSLAMNNGRRKAELPRFKVSYFDKENIICEGALYKTPEKVITKGKGSRGKPLELYTLVKGFQPYFDLWMDERKKLNIKSEWLFPKYSNGKWLDEQADAVLFDSWANTFSRIIERPFYWHALRHYFTTKLLDSNIPEGVVQDIIGWSSGDMVRLYNDATGESQFEKYFGADGIKNVEAKGLKEL